MRLSDVSLNSNVFPKMNLIGHFPTARITRVKKTHTVPKMSLEAIESSPSLVQKNTTPALFGSKAFKVYKSVMSVVTTLFPVWTLISSAVALKSPSSFDWVTTECYTGALAALMLSMGITLTPAEFGHVAQRPNGVILQFFLCYGIMPVVALLLGKAAKLDSALVAGMVLVGSINNAQAANVCTYIAKGNVALSVLMSSATTLGAIFLTPLLCHELLGTIVAVNARGIASSTVQVVLAPIATGMALKKLLPNAVKFILPFAPVVGVMSTCLLVASSVAQVAPSILEAGLGLQFPILLLHVVGAFLGYVISKVSGFGEMASRTIAIGTAMKSAAFSFLLAKLHFGEYSVRVPSAVSVVWMALTGSILAAIWRHIPLEPHFDRSMHDKYPPFHYKTLFLKRRQTDDQ